VTGGGTGAGATTGTGAPAGGPATGLRERKKIKTRRTIRNAAYRLFEEQGYDATTVEQIAAEAEVSPSTFFRYFPTKEDLVLSDEYDPLIEAAIVARPADEPVVESMRVAILDLLRRLFDEDRAEVLQRVRLIRDVPALRARMGENLNKACVLVANALARRSGRPAAGFELRVLAAALMGGWNEALMHWVNGEGEEDLVALLDRALTVMSEGLSATSRSAARRSTAR
jgi:AcrR family transcriptional regulator